MRKFVTITLMCFASINLVHAEEKKSSSSENASFHGSKTLKDKNYNELTINGPADLEKVTANSLKVNGPLKSLNIKVKKMNIKGPTILTNAQVNTAEAHGPTEVAGSTIADTISVYGPMLTFTSKFLGPVKVLGPIDALSVAFEKSLTIGGHDSKFEKCVTKKIIVSKPTGLHAMKQVVHVKGGSIEEVEFEGGNGVVEADKEAKVGRVVGGALNKPK